MSNRQNKRNPHAYEYVDKPSTHKRQNDSQHHRHNRNNDNYVILQKDPFEIVMWLCGIAFMALLFFLA